MPAGQDRPVPFISHPQTCLKLPLCFHFHRSFSEHMNGHRGEWLPFTRASVWLSDISVTQRSSRWSNAAASHLKVFVLRSSQCHAGGARFKYSSGCSLLTPASVFASHTADWTAGSKRVDKNLKYELRVWYNLADLFELNTSGIWHKNSTKEHIHAESTPSLTNHSVLTRDFWIQQTCVFCLLSF